MLSSTTSRSLLHPHVKNACFLKLLPFYCNILSFFFSLKYFHFPNSLPHTNSLKTLRSCSVFLGTPNTINIQVLSNTSAFNFLTFLSSEIFFPSILLHHCTFPLPTKTWHLPSASTRIKSQAAVTTDPQHTLKRVQGGDQE